MTGPLPVLVPSTATVEAVARRFARDNDPAMTYPSRWQEAPAYIKNWYTSRALTYLSAGAPNLIGDVIEYLVSNHQGFEFSAHTTDQLIDAMMRAREAVAPSCEDPITG